MNVSGKLKFPTSSKRSASPAELLPSKRGRTSTERRRSLDSISSISSSSLDRDKDDDVIFIRSSRSKSPRNHKLVSDDEMKMIIILILRYFLHENENSRSNLQ